MVPLRSTKFRSFSPAINWKRHAAKVVVCCSAAAVEQLEHLLIVIEAVVGAYSGVALGGPAIELSLIHI